MATKRLTLRYSVAAILIGLTIIGTSLYMNPAVSAKTGTLSVLVTDAPAPDLRDLNLTISNVEVLNSTGTWIPLTIDGGTKYFDLLKLHDITDDLAKGALPEGNFSKIRMKIETANATLIDGNTTDLNVPSGHIDLQVKFEIKAGKTTVLLIDIIVDKVQIAERGSSGKPSNLNPQFKFKVTPPS